MSRVTVITGASAGIGAATARLLAGAGHHVVLAGRHEGRLSAVARSLDGSAEPVVADVTRRGDVERLRDAAIERFGRIDVWINNAGRGITRSVMDLSDEDVSDMIDANVRSVLYGMQAVVPYFQGQGAGHLINVSSFLARVPLAPLRSIYSAAKSAVNSLTASLATELRATHPGVHLSVVMPGLVDTDFARNAKWSAGATPAPAAPAAAAMRAQSADEVAAVIARVIAAPVREAYTNPASPGIARRYFDELGAFSPLDA